VSGSCDPHNRQSLPGVGGLDRDAMIPEPCRDSAFRPLRLRHPTKLAKAVHCGKVFRANLGKRASTRAASRVDMTHEALD
jgi:hypothetical protein